MARIRQGVALVATAAMAVGLTGCEPPAPFFASSTSAGYAVSNGYDPVVGDFDGDGWDDIIFLEPDRWDALWEGRADGRFTHLAAPAQLDGAHVGLVGDLGGDATDDVLWYRSDGEPSPLWVMQAGGGLAEIREVTLPGDADLTVIENATDHDTVLVRRLSGEPTVWDPDSGSDAVVPLGTTAAWEGAVPGDLDGDGHGDVFLHRPGAAADEIAWGDGDDSFTLSTTTNIKGSYQVHVLRADGDGRDDIAFIDERVGHPWAFNVWFSEGRTFRRVTYPPVANRGIYRVHRNHLGGPESLVKYTHGGAFAWSVGPDGAARLSGTTALPGPGTVPVFVGRFHDGVADDAFVYDRDGLYREALLRTPAPEPTAP